MAKLTLTRGESKHPRVQLWVFVDAPSTSELGSKYCRHHHHHHVHDFHVHHHFHVYLHHRHSHRHVQAIINSILSDNVSGDFN